MFKMKYFLSHTLMALIYGTKMTWKGIVFPFSICRPYAL